MQSKATFGTTDYKTTDNQEEEGRAQRARQKDSEQGAGEKAISFQLGLRGGSRIEDGWEQSA